MTTKIRAIADYEIPAEKHPLAEDIKVFLEIFNALNVFECEQRFLSGCGAFPKETEMPVPEVMRVQAWLKSLALTKKEKTDG